jgi:hypothetical protein
MIYTIFGPALVIGCPINHYLLCFTKPIKLIYPGVPFGFAATPNYETTSYFCPFCHYL